MTGKELIEDISHLWAPPPKLSVSGWADQNRILSAESGAAAGRWHTLPFQREVFDAFSDPATHTIVIMSATQLVKTEALLNFIGYVVAIDPGPALLILPRDSDVDRFSKIRLAPMVRDTPCLREKLVETKQRRTANTLDHKSFPGGHLTIAAAGSPGNLAALPIRFLLADEIDKFPATSGSEGDPISLALKRTATFWNRKIVLACSPTIDGASRIAKAYDASDQREFLVPCPSCGEAQALRWDHVRWDNTLLTKEQRAATAHYECPACGASWNDIERWRAVEAGHWEAAAPFAGVAGFRISELCSPWKRLAEIVLDFLIKKDDPMQLQTFVNTSLAETWKQRGEAPEWERIYARREDYQSQAAVPIDALMLVAAVDCQADRLEFEAVAYGADKQSWSIFYTAIPGDPTDVSASGPWATVDELLAANWPHASGGTIPIWAVAIDSGNRPQPVYQFAMRHARPAVSPAGVRVTQHRTVIVVKGNDDNLKLISNVSNADAANRRGGIHVIHIGTHWAKQELHDLLRLAPPEGKGTYPPGFPHFPVAYERDYFRGLCSESRAVRASGKIEYVKDPSVRNEPLDLRVYARAAAELCGLSRLTENQWGQIRALIARNRPDEEVPAPRPQPQKQSLPQRRFVGDIDVTHWLDRRR